MHRLAKLGFTQSYTYFTWRNTQAGADGVFHRARRDPGRDYFRPNCLAEHARHPAEYLQLGGRAAFMAAPCSPPRWARATASTARRSSCWSTTPREPGSEEYLDSEKYQMQPLGSRPRRTASRLHRPAEPHSPRQAGAAERPESAVPDRSTTNSSSAIARAPMVRRRRSSSS